MKDWTFEKSFFRREIRRVNISRIVLAAAVLVAIVLLDTRHTVTLAAAKFRGTAEVTVDEIASITNPETELTELSFSANHENSSAFEADIRLKRLMYVKDGSCLLSLKPDAITETNYSAMEKSGNVSASIEYVYARLNGKLMIVKRSKLEPVDVLTGTIGYLPADIKIAVTENSDVELEDVLPVIMDTTGDAFSSLTTDIAFSSVILVIWSLWFFSIIHRTLRYDRSPAYKRLFTCAGTVEENARAIDEELSGRADFGLFGNIVTENWHIRRRPFSFLVEPRSSYTDN